MKQNLDTMNPKSAIENYKSSISRSSDADSKGASTMTALRQSAQDPNAAPKVTALRQSMQSPGAAPPMTALTQSAQNPNTAPQMTAVPQSAQDYNAYTREAIAGIYDAQREKRLAEIEQAYGASLSAAEAAKGQIGGAYQEQRNNLADTYERTRRNTNEAAAASGLNVGTGSQAALMQRSEYQRDNTRLGTAEADAMAKAEQGIADLKAKYQSDIASANAENDYQRSVALLSQYKAEYDQQLSRAQTLAQYGDFTGYAAVYGQEQADNMRKAWIATNPDVAYNTGNISAEEYRAVTGTYPKGYTAPGSGGYSGYGGGYNNQGMSTSEVKDIQRKLGVTVDGLWGDETRTAYENYIARSNTPPSSSTRNNVINGGGGNSRTLAAIR